MLEFLVFIIGILLAGDVIIGIVMYCVIWKEYESSIYDSIIISFKELMNLNYDDFYNKSLNRISELTIVGKFLHFIMMFIMFICPYIMAEIVHVICFMCYKFWILICVKH